MFLGFLFIYFFHCLIRYFYFYVFAFRFLTITNMEEKGPDFPFKKFPSISQVRETILLKTLKNIYGFVFYFAQLSLLTNR